MRNDGDFAGKQAAEPRACDQLPGRHPAWIAAPVFRRGLVDYGDARPCPTLGEHLNRLAEEGLGLDPADESAPCGRVENAAPRLQVHRVSQSRPIHGARRCWTCPHGGHGDVDVAPGRVGGRPSRADEASDERHCGHCDPTRYAADGLSRHQANPSTRRAPR